MAAFDDDLVQVADAYRPAVVAHPRPGWAEKDAEQVVDGVTSALAEVAGAVGAGAISAIGLDNEGETVVAWDARTLRPLAPAVVWSCRRSQPIVERLAAAGAGEEVVRLAGTPLDPYFSATKIRWLVENVPAVAAAVRAGNGRFGTLDAYLRARLVGEAATDPSTAARTQLQELARPGRWSERLCELHGVDPEWLPAIGPSTGALGGWPGGAGAPPLPLCASLVDQTAALAGHGCVQPGDVKATYGTGIFVLAHAGAETPAAGMGLLPTIAWWADGLRGYALEGGVFSAGSAIDWLRDGAGLLRAAADSEALAASVPDCGGVRFLPALGGIGAPWWLPDVRAAWTGISAHTTRAHLVRAVLESLAYRVRDVVEALAGAGRSPAELRVDGGLTANRWFVGFQADVLGIPVRVSGNREATARGAAALAGIGAGLFDPGRLAALGQGGTRIDPSPGSQGWRDQAYADWRDGLRAIAGLGRGA